MEPFVDPATKKNPLNQLKKDRFYKVINHDWVNFAYPVPFGLISESFLHLSTSSEDKRKLANFHTTFHAYGSKTIKDFEKDFNFKTVPQYSSKFAQDDHTRCFQMNTIIEKGTPIEEDGVPHKIYECVTQNIQYKDLAKEIIAHEINNAKNRASY